MADKYYFITPTGETYFKNQQRRTYSPKINTVPLFSLMRMMASNTNVLGSRDVSRSAILFMSNPDEKYSRGQMTNAFNEAIKRGYIKLNRLRRN